MGVLRVGRGGMYEHRCVVPNLEIPTFVIGVQNR